jgi:hypothetical protein
MGTTANDVDTLTIEHLRRERLLVDLLPHAVDVGDHAVKFDLRFGCTNPETDSKSAYMYNFCRPNQGLARNAPGPRAFAAQPVGLYQDGFCSKVCRDTGSCRSGGPTADDSCVVVVSHHLLLSSATTT